MTCHFHNRKLLVTAAAILVCLGLGPGALHSMFARPDLIKTPVDRLVENISKQVEKEPQNVALQVNLARTHAMAWAKKTDELDVEKRKPNEPFFGYLPPRIPFGEVIELNDDFQKENKLDAAAIEKLRAAAAQHLKLAIQSYRKALELDPDQATAQLGLAWALDQSGNQEDAIDLYRKIVADGWEKEKDLEIAPMGFQSIVAEAAGYLLDKLDENDDKQEIEELSQKIDRVNQIVRPVTPIAIALQPGDYGSVYDASAAVPFDADGSGRRSEWTWIRPPAGWLVYDHHREGKITSALQLFGGVTFWCFWQNGYQALSALDDNQDGWLRGSELAELAVWQDLNQNGMSDLGEVRPLAAFDIIGIDCACVRTSIGQESIACNLRGCLRGDGSSLPTYDVILHRADSPLTQRTLSGWGSADFTLATQ